MLHIKIGNINLSRLRLWLWAIQCFNVCTSRSQQSHVILLNQILHMANRALCVGHYQLVYFLWAPTVNDQSHKYCTIVGTWLLTAVLSESKNGLINTNTLQ